MHIYTINNLCSLYINNKVKFMSQKLYNLLVCTKSEIIHNEYIAVVYLLTIMHTYLIFLLV